MDLKSEMVKAFLNLGVAMLTLGAGWLVGQRLTYRWAIRQKKRELLLVAAFPKIPNSIDLLDNPSDGIYYIFYRDYRHAFSAKNIGATTGPASRAGGGDPGCDTELAVRLRRDHRTRLPRCPDRV